MTLVHSSAEGGASIPTELVARLEVASEGDRELDGLMHGAEHGLALNGCTFMLEIHGRETFQFRHPTLMHPNGPAALYVGGYDVPEVTTSLDAALALAERVLPGETFWNIAHSSIISGRKMYWAEVSPPDDGNPEGWDGFAPTPALALCIAILKATTAPESGAVGTTEGREPKNDTTREGADR